MTTEQPQKIGARPPSPPYPLPLFIRAAVHRPYPRPLPRPVAPLAFTYDYFSERATPDCPLDWVAYRAAEHSPFALMCADVTAALAAEPLDLVAVAHTDPDCAPDISIAGFLAARRGDTPVVVAFSDQGRLAPFSALQVALAYRQHQARFQAVLVALRQAAAPYAAPGREAGGMDEAVGVLLGDTGDIELAGLHQFVDVEPESMLGLLATRLPADLVEPVRVLWTGLPGITGLLASRSATARTVPVECRPGHLWRHLASELASRPGRAGSVLTVDYDETTTGGAAALFVHRSR